MICKMCATGADIQSRLKEEHFVDRLVKRANLVSRAFHSSCKGETHCDCQHKEAK